MLIHAGADVNVPNKNNFIPLLAACVTQNLKIVELLLQFGANINQQDEYGATALHYAVMNDNIQLVDRLLYSGADTSLTNCDGRNALMIALRKHKSCAEKIIPFTTDLNCVDSKEWFALMYAVSKPNVNKNVVLKMIERGAVINIKVLVCSAFYVEYSSIFDYLWDHTDIEILKEEENEIYKFISGMLYIECFTPEKIRYLYKVLDTPGVELNCGGYIEMLVDSVMEFYEICEVEDFLSIDVYGIVNKFFEKGAILIDSDIKHFILMINRYDFDYKYKLLQILIDNHANFNDLEYIYLSVENDPEFTIFLLHFCIIYGPIDVVKCMNRAKRLDIPVLKLLKYILRLCTLEPKLRTECIQHLISFNISSVSDISPKEAILTLDLYNQILELLSKNRVPTLKEMSRDVIRKSIVSHFNFCPTTHDYLNSLKLMNLPKFMTDIIQCKSTVISIDDVFF